MSTPESPSRREVADARRGQAPAAASVISTDSDSQLLGAAAAPSSQTVGVSGLIGQAVSAFLSAFAAAVSSWQAQLLGVNPEPSAPGSVVGFSGQPSLLTRIVTAAFGLARSFYLEFATTNSSAIVSTSPPAWLTDDLTVTQTEFDGMLVYELSSTDPSGKADPSGKYVVAIHGGGYVTEPTVGHWLSYTEMVRATNATVFVPIYPLAPDGTAATVVPLIADFISAQIAQYGAANVGLIGDSAGGGLALSAAELLVTRGASVPSSMVLESPWLDVTLTNPDIELVTDTVLDRAQSQQDGLLWAGALDPTDPLVSPLYGSLAGLPPTYVYCGSDEMLAPDVLLLQQHAIAVGAPISFTLRNGEIHDWALAPILDGAQVQPQIYAQLGLQVDPAVQ